MRFKRKLLTALLAGTFVAGFAGTSHAAVVYNSTIVGFTPNIFGFAVPGENFALGTVTDASGDTIEIGLRARYRVRPTQASNATGLYGVFDAGTQTAAFGSPARSDRAEWSYDFFIRTAGGAGNEIADYSFSLCADLDRSAVFAPDCVNPVTFFGDNKPLGSTTELGNSMQLFFAGTPGNATYNPFVGGLYSFSLSVTEGTTLLETVGITAQVPEPGTLAILGLGLAGLGFARRRNKA